MESELSGLRIDRSKRRSSDGPRWAKIWIITGILILLTLGAARLVYSGWNSGVEVDVMRVMASTSASSEPGIILNATGYIVAAHKIQVASKVLGRVAWIGVDKGYKVQKGQVIARLEDDEFRAQLQQGEGQLANLQAKLAEVQNGSRPEEVALARANLEQAKADLENAQVTLQRAKKLVDEKISSQQVLDDAQARYDASRARVASLDRSYELVRIGPRQEQIDALKGQVLQARGLVDYYKTQLENTEIRAPVTGTILERAVEPGEFITTSFVGDKGAKGFVVTMADLNDLQVELDINQNDFAKLGSRQRGIITTDAFPDRKYQGYIAEISPEANRQKATVQVKVKVEQPDEYLRPEMNASVAFYQEAPAAGKQAASERPAIVVPASAVRSDGVFVVLGGKAVRRTVKVGPSTSRGVHIEQGLIGGEDLIINPPQDLKAGDKVKLKKG